MRNSNYKIRKEFEENECRGFYDPELCYHPEDDCRCREGIKGKCACLVDTMFIDASIMTYDCPFYKTQEQFDLEDEIGRKRRQKNYG